MLLGNKADMASERMIRTEDGEKLARVKYFINISTDSIGRARIFEIMSVKAFRTDVIVSISDAIICFMSDWLINLHKRVTNWPNIFVDQSQFSDPDFISSTHQT